MPKVQCNGLIHAAVWVFVSRCTCYFLWSLSRVTPSVFDKADGKTGKAYYQQRGQVDGLSLVSQPPFGGHLNETGELRLSGLF